MHLMGLDVGTTGCKAALFDEAGQLRACASREYAVDFPRAQWAEQDAEQVWRLACDCLREIAPQVDGPSALACSVQGEAVIAVDADGQALRPAILGMDTRTGAENDWLRARFGARWLFDHTGMPVHTINTLPKLLWLKTHEPDVWASAQQFVLYEDFFIRRLTGQAAISACLASRTQMLALHSGRWSSEILSGIGLDEARLSPVVPSGSAVAPMRTTLAGDLGFSMPPLIVTGGHDQACGALGVGLTRPGLAMVSTGTAEVVEIALAAPVLNDMLYAGNISVYAHVIPGLYLAMTLNHSGGLLLRWFRDTLCQTDVAAAQLSGRDAYDLILADASDTPTSLLVLPHFAGSGTPTFDTQSKGAILGLTFATTKAELARALLEGLTCELRANLELLRDGGIAIDELRAIGGGARSALWLQLKADLTEIPVVASPQVEAASWGAAILAGVGAGCYERAEQAPFARRSDMPVFLPRAEVRDGYRRQFALFQQLYAALAPFTRQL